MDQSTLAILVAGIPAFGAAMTFAATEILRGRRRRQMDIADAVGELSSALVALVAVEDRPVLIRRYHHTQAITRVSAASTKLLSVVRRRDRVFAYWIVQSSETLTEQRLTRVEWAAMILASLRMWEMFPHEQRSRAMDDLGTVPGRLR